MFSKESFQVYLSNCLEGSTFKASHDDCIGGMPLKLPCAFQYIQFTITKKIQAV